MTAVDDRPRVAELTDLELVELAQSGSQDAVGELWLRHYPSTLRAASAVTRQPWDAEELSSEAFTAMMAACQNGHGPTSSVRAYLATSVRNLAARRATGPRSAEVPSDDPTRYEDVDRLDPDAVARNAELGLVREAFSSLPDRWQAVLWRTAVDHDSHDRVAEAMGLSRNGVAALAVRARRALKVAYLQAHVSRGAVEIGCQPFLGQLAGLSQGARATSPLQSHLSGCGRCRERLTELAKVEQNVAGFLLPAVAVLVPTVTDLTAGGLAGLSAAASGAGAATGPTRAETMGQARRGRQVRNAAVAALLLLLLAGTAFALTRPDTPAAGAESADSASASSDSAAAAPPAAPPAAPGQSTPTAEPTPPTAGPTPPTAGPTTTTPLPAGSPAPNAATRPGALLPGARVPTPVPNPTATPSAATPTQVYAPATLTLSVSSGVDTVTVQPTALTPSGAGTLQLSLSLPIGVNLTGSSGTWTGCTQSGSIVTCNSAAVAGGSATGSVTTAWPAGIAGTITATLTGTTPSGAPISSSLGLPWPLI